MPARNNVTRMLDAKKVAYTPVEYDSARFHSADEVARLIGAPAGQVFKTIVVLAETKGRRPLLVILPGDREIDLRRLAAAVGEKKLRPAPQREAESLTRLQVGGISALALIGRPFDVYLDRAAERYAEDGIYVSAGQRGLNLRLRPTDLLALTGGHWVDASAADPA
ncbi:MAG: YbaK/EbsC family protein [Dehalococcoidia bacterium]